ncbi:hypothetical protein MSAN_02018800 [Mycena sanguinolenta]|uniref:Zn(2)-C6 fungal-type domain-containing protein n=1 Tax=Mycena sanguinolenta TaxID=230812 RepID=A0A8H6XLS3_9AGAR|nr:hypothetical protein MSAN_02018800 [Mycena sanguinolenta]
MPQRPNESTKAWHKRLLSHTGLQIGLMPPADKALFSQLINSPEPANDEEAPKKERRKSGKAAQAPQLEGSKTAGKRARSASAADTDNEDNGLAHAKKRKSTQLQTPATNNVSSDEDEHPKMQVPKCIPCTLRNSECVPASNGRQTVCKDCQSRKTRCDFANNCRTPPLPTVDKNGLFRRLEEMQETLRRIADSLAAGNAASVVPGPSNSSDDEDTPAVGPPVHAARKSWESRHLAFRQE